MGEKQNLIVPVVLAGGRGVRLWPLSHENHPKQLLRLIDNYTLLQNTINLVKIIPNSSLPVIVANDNHRFIIAEQMREIQSDVVLLLEAQSKNTAFAVALAAFFSKTKEKNPLMLVLPADLYIPSTQQFAAMIANAVETANKEKLIVFGVQPILADTNYGYIKRGAQIAGCSAFEVDCFIEKPDLKSAQSFIHEGGYYWNSGLFLFQAATFLDQLEKYAPKVYRSAQETINKMFIERDFIRFDESSSAQCPNISIDTAVFEKTNRAVVFPFMGEWQDLGDWHSLYAMGKKDGQGNVVSKHVVTFDTSNSYLYSSKKLLVTSGMQDCLVVATDDAILVSRLDEKQDIKEIVGYLEKMQVLLKDSDG
ncbi:TPA: mannose-1-phosphate guanylyltransferase/mannose-6-phosphate isomerase [Legionella pneumophila]|uniref:mannose-1-phosphate guanylyltransferase n=1 Tax=Legionella pneumophila TaxID=446 RepID=A0AAN5TBH9_LEGPN|nr:mannose-1-phosphate guanylyltransferase/mannose-6-phosphate isomerase [Legionella pneumophila]RYX49030.1 mannose-1-phosphate guanylyltransferase/mannose-6-phosphate isomerase [Legionella pneumophila]HAT1864023.1 mannose-1-phosphate guanylyltransferase/mannose-6-phosphate isomerase [Legionella pneumophila]HAT7747160.1 mannose-1-phosphate guanylyltransferase/mannose-6-phosphate isomerase [Legionella pneumophila]HAT7759692.1 mannose-1-phosphate guanylyltransferase/mannose-6-phosphate isomerase 